MYHSQFSEDNRAGSLLQKPHTAADLFNTKRGEGSVKLQEGGFISAHSGPVKHLYHFQAIQPTESHNVTRNIV